MTAERQGSAEWLEARRGLITSSDIPILLGLSPWACEADLADEKLGGAGQDSTLRMRVGLELQALIGREYERATGRRLLAYRRIVRHPTITWAAASPDFGVRGERMLVEAKHTASRSRFADGLPQDVEAQVAWQLGVTRRPAADVAVLIADEDLQIFTVEADADLFANLVAVAADFRRRLEAGGPFSRDAARIKRDHPRDDGSVMEADAELAEAVQRLLLIRGQMKDFELAELQLESAIKARMGDAAVLEGGGFRVTWKQTKDVATTDWKSIADGLLQHLAEPERSALVGLHTTVRAGFRPFRVIDTKEKE